MGSNPLEPELSRKRTARVWPQVAAAALIGTPLLLVAIEFALRLFGVASGPVVLVDAYSCFLELEPGTHVRHQRAGLVHDLWLDGNGFRVSEAVARGQAARTEAACRILALGDSFTEGFYVAPEQTWPAQVEMRLREAGYDVVVDNGGFRSRSIQDARHAALTRWGSLGHDLVIVEHTANDLQDLVDATRAGCAGATPDWLRHARLYRLAELAAVRIAATKRAIGAASSPRECRAAAADYREHLLATAAAVRSSRRRFVFVMLEPFMCGDGTAQLNWHSYTEELQTALAEKDALFVDASSVFRSPGRRFEPIDYHPNAAGYAAAAAIIADALDTARVLSRCRAVADR